ncbi:MAG: hypothetical protein AVDCRST_MAG56-7445 [uncultured Cytophagales bacterium]|uniref:Uncharacterized protein n=1 Tax=uncultured Cytophagales bacterium TaxID=158755 RepID=A0A6J4L638_9SPHI|nr:MAG: hypothetical protein AVDCRST_MAG56-7445 [uncultured Cytophagales bacterium]
MEKEGRAAKRRLKIGVVFSKQRFFRFAREEAFFGKLSIPVKENDRGRWERASGGKQAVFSK